MCVCVSYGEKYQDEALGIVIHVKLSRMILTEGRSWCSHTTCGAVEHNHSGRMSRMLGYPRRESRLTNTKFYKKGTGGPRR